MLLKCIGDVHSKYGRYKEIIKNRTDTVQVGDMGVGFRKLEGPNVGKIYDNPPYYAMKTHNHRFIRGNHDNPFVCKTQSMWIPDGTVEDGVMFVGGAVSIDKGLRFQGYDWWSEEELSYIELADLVLKYCEIKPRAMVTHDCPEFMGRIMANMDKLEFPSATRMAFEQMWNAHRPQVWVFGHWHRSYDNVIMGTRFVCLNELEYKEIEVAD